MLVHIHIHVHVHVHVVILEGCICEGTFVHVVLYPGPSHNVWVVPGIYMYSTVYVLFVHDPKYM